MEVVFLAVRSGTLGTSEAKRALAWVVDSVALLWEKVELVCGMQWAKREDGDNQRKK